MKTTRVVAKSTSSKLSMIQIAEYLVLFMDLMQVEIFIKVSKGVIGLIDLIQTLDIFRPI